MTSERELEALADAATALDAAAEIIALIVPTNDAIRRCRGHANNLRELARRLQPARVPEGGLDREYVERMHAKSRNWQGQISVNASTLAELCRTCLSAAPAPEAGKCERCGARNADDAETMCKPMGDDCPGVALFDKPEAVMANGMTAAETEATASVMGLSREAETMRDWSARMPKCEPLGHEIDKLMADNIEVFLDGEPEAGQREEPSWAEYWIAQGRRDIAHDFALFEHVEAWMKARRLASAQQAGNPWDTIISEIQRRAESDGADERGSDFTVTISIGEYRKAMRNSSRGDASSLLRKPGPLPSGCYCKPGKCAAPVILGRQTACRDPKKAAQAEGEA